KKQVEHLIADVVSQQDESVQIRNLKILIAEDDETSDLLLTKMLEKNNHEVLHVNTGEKAVEICRNISDFDLILMDIRMPGMNGYEATRHIRKFNTDVIIIAQTAYGLSGDRQKSIDAGCNEYLSKPIDKNELLRLMQKYFES
ncbi:MAG: response regulator, partial [Bacteroidota bacterium]